MPYDIENMSVVTFELKDQVAIVRLARPEKFNAMGKEYFEEMPAVLTKLGSDENIKVLLLTAEGPHFSSGLDLSELAKISEYSSGSSTASKIDLFERIQRLQLATKVLANLRVPSIASVSGYCLGGGVDLISACSLRYCSNDVIFSIRETKLAIVADLGSLQLLPSIIPRGALYELALTGRDFSAKEAKEIGLVNGIFEDKQAAETHALEIAKEIASNSASATQGTKRILDSIYNKNLSRDLERVALWNTSFLNQKDISEVAKAFAEKRKPNFG